MCDPNIATINGEEVNLKENGLTSLTAVTIMSEKFLDDHKGDLKTAENLAESFKEAAEKEIYARLGLHYYSPWERRRDGTKAVLHGHRIESD